VFIENLNYYKTYIIFIDTNATDIAGNTLFKPYIIKFTTVDAYKQGSEGKDRGVEKHQNYIFLIILIIIWVVIILILLMVPKRRRKRIVKKKMSYPRQFKNWLLGYDKDTGLIEELAALSKRLTEEAIDKAIAKCDSKKIKMAKKYLAEGDTFRKSALDGNEEDFQKAIKKYNDAVDVTKNTKR
jgi:hypothetical protein